MANRVLYIATNASAGMRHFVVSVLKAMFAEPTMDCYAIVQSEPDNDYRKDIPEEFKNRVVFMDAPLGKVERISALLYPKRLYKEIVRLCKSRQIETIHFLTEDPCVSSVLKLLKKRYRLYYTVHDLEVHEIRYRNVFHKMWHYWSHRNRVMELINGIDNLVTCSHFQYERLVEDYPQKRIYYHAFPSLVTDNVKRGSMKVAELERVDDYVLFFGRIEKYKGIECLYDVFRYAPCLRKERLVIAGKGDIYFETCDLPNVFFVNRFIRDEEIKDLFRKAKCVVFPYISATQSGVFSFCFYFKKPVVASDIPLFREFVDEGADVRLFKAGNVEDLAEELCDVEKKVRQTNDYERIYGEDTLKQSLLKLYEA